MNAHNGYHPANSEEQLFNPAMTQRIQPRLHSLPSQMRLQYALFLLIGLLGSSCYTARVYAPHTQIIPGFTGKNQGQVQVHSISNLDNKDWGNKKEFSNSVKGICIQAAYAPLNHLGLSLNYANVKDNDRFKNFEMALGYSGQPLPNVIVEAYTGFGSGTSHSGDDFTFNERFEDAPDGPFIYNGHTVKSYVYGDMRYKRWFIQPSLTVKVSDYLEFAFGFKYSRVNFFDLRISHGPIPTEDYEDDVEDAMEQVERAQTIADHGAYAFIEPSFTVRGGTQNLKAQLQFGFSNTKDKQLDEIIYPSYTSVGVIYSFPKKTTRMISSDDSRNNRIQNTVKK